MTCLLCLYISFTHGVVFHPLTVHIERHVGRVAPSTVGDETCIRPHVLVAQFYYLQNTGRGTGSDLYTVISGGQSLTVHAPLDGWFGEAIEGTGDGCRGAVQEVKVRGKHGELGCSCVYIIQTKGNVAVRKGLIVLKMEPKNAIALVKSIPPHNK